MHSILFVQFIMALGCILLVTFITGRLFLKLRQPVVVGEMIAGILIGPTLLGSVFPGLAKLFPSPVISQLTSFGGIGLAIFMFLIGLDLANFKRQQVRESLTLTLSGFILPFIFGLLVASILYERNADHSVSIINFALFMGVALAMTSIPMLARMLQNEKAVTKKLVGITLMAASLDDVLAWCILSVILAFIKSHTWMQGLYTTIYGLIFVFVMLLVVKPIMRKFGRKVEQSGLLSYNGLFVIVILILIVCVSAEKIGISSVFGCFLLGLIMPKTPIFTKEVQSRLQPLTSVLLLPVYFAVSGLNFNLQSITGWNLLLTCLLLITVSVLGKYLGCMFALKWIGFKWREASAVGGLMNARGMMGMIVANIGLSYGIINIQLFSMLVLMSVVTTVIAMPIYKISLNYRRRYSQEKNVWLIKFRKGELNE